MEIEKLNVQFDKAVKLHQERRATIFIEEALTLYNEVFGPEKTRQYLKDMIEYFNQFK